MIQLLAGLVLSVQAPAPDRLRISSGGHPAGYATISQAILADGSKKVDLRLELSSAGKKVRLTSQSMFDSQGLPTRKFQETRSAAGGVTRQVVVTFAGHAAIVVLTQGDKRTNRRVELASAAPYDTQSEFWFIRDHPAAGETEKSYQFSTDTLRWDLVSTTYVGDKPLSVGGHTVTAHEVVSRQGDRETTSYLDDRGLPIRIDQGGVRMERMGG